MKLILWSLFLIAFGMFLGRTTDVFWEAMTGFAVVFVITIIVLIAKAAYGVDRLRKESRKYWDLRAKHGDD